MNTFGASLKRSIGYVTQSRLVTCFLSNVTSSCDRPGEALHGRALLVVLASARVHDQAGVAGDVQRLGDDLAGLLVDLMSATQQDIVFE